MALKEDMKITKTILRDMSDGVMVVGKSGEIEFMNEAGAGILNKSPEDLVGKMYGEFIEQDSQNDDFHQIILDAIYDKNIVHGGIVTYRGHDFKKRLRMTSSFVLSDDMSDQLGISVVFSDVTELEHLSEIRRESSIIFSSLMACITLYMFIWRAVFDAGIRVSPQVMNLVIEVMAIIAMVIVINTTSISVSDFNLKLAEPWRQMRGFVVIAVIGSLLLVLIKYLILRLNIPFFPADKPFWDWGVVNFGVIVYPATALLQEVLARCMMQNSLHYIFTGKHKAALSVIVSSLVFGAVHIAYGIKYMIAAFLLLSLLGTFYEKTRNLWGVALVHYVMGVYVVFLHYTI